MFRFLTILALVVSTLRLYVNGLLTPEWVIITLLTGVGALTFGWKWRIISMAVGGFLLFVRQMSAGDQQAAIALGTSILMLAVVLYAIHLIIRAPFSRR